MQKYSLAIVWVVCVLVFQGCTTAYEVKPVPFKLPGAYPNVQEKFGAKIAAKAFNDPAEAKDAFGFDIRGAGMFPVQVIFENNGSSSLEIDPSQTFLKDAQGNVWQILPSNLAYERATKYSQTKNIVKEGAYSGMLGAAAGSILGAAIGIVAGDNVLEAVGKGAAVGAAAGATLGGIEGHADNQPQRSIAHDLKEKSLQNKAVAPKSLAHGFIFFPSEAGNATQLRLKLTEKETGKAEIIEFLLY